MAYGNFLDLFFKEEENVNSEEPLIWKNEASDGALPAIQKSVGCFCTRKFPVALRKA